MNNSNTKSSACLLYKGIPFGKAGRFEKAVSIPWTGLPSGQDWPAQAWQMPNAPGSFYDTEFYKGDLNIVQDEDCLYLNIWAPKDAQNAPVAFWIHGGGFDHGFSYERPFDGESFCKQGIILVTVAYRLGVLGFLHSKWTDQTNLGLQDQQLALEWVYENISHFGGDPKNITVFGQSAGCMSAAALVQAPGCRHQISKAIFQSGIGIPLSKTREQAIEIAEEFFRFARIESKEQLYAMPAKELTALQNAFLPGHPLAFSPILDEETLPAWLPQGNPLPIPYMIGSTLNDIGVSRDMLAKGQRGWLYEGALAFARSQSQKGAPDCYVYDFVRQLPGDEAGAFHSSELWYMFNSLERCWRPMEEGDYALARYMNQAWARFMKTGNPGWSAWPYIEVLDVR